MALFHSLEFSDWELCLGGEFGARQANALTGVLYPGAHLTIHFGACLAHISLISQLAGADLIDQALSFDYRR